MLVCTPADRPSAFEILGTFAFLEFSTRFPKMVLQ